MSLKGTLRQMFQMFQQQMLLRQMFQQQKIDGYGSLTFRTDYIITRLLAEKIKPPRHNAQNCLELTYIYAHCIFFQPLRGNLKLSKYDYIFMVQNKHTRSAANI